MIDFTLVQQHARDIVATAEPFASEATEGIPLVHKDTGNIYEAEQRSLLHKGYYATVLPLLDGDQVAQGGSTGVIDAGVAVRVAINPAGTQDQSNSGAYIPPKDIYQLVKAVKQTLLGWKKLVEAERYKLAQKCFLIDDTDPGELAYVLFFTKRCVL